jgi:hypothetical protein
LLGNFNALLSVRIFVFGVVVANQFAGKVKDPFEP